MKNSLGCIITVIILALIIASVGVGPFLEQAINGTGAIIGIVVCILFLLAAAGAFRD